MNESLDERTKDIDLIGTDRFNLIQGKKAESVGGHRMSGTVLFGGSLAAPGHSNLNRAKGSSYTRSSPKGVTRGTPPPLLLRAHANPIRSTYDLRGSYSLQNQTVPTHTDMLCLPSSFSFPPTDSPSHYLPTLIPFRPTWYRYPTIPGQRDPAQSLAVDTLHKASSERVSQTQIQPGMFLAERVIATTLTTLFRAPPSRRDTR